MMLKKHFDAILQYLSFFPLDVNGKEIVLVDKKIAGGLSRSCEKNNPKGIFFYHLVRKKRLS